jgi:hypothetical protein
VFFRVANGLLFSFVVPRLVETKGMDGNISDVFCVLFLIVSSFFASVVVWAGGSP